MRNDSSETTLPITTECPVCGADVFGNDAEVKEEDTEGEFAYPPCVHCALDIAITNPPDPEMGEPLAIFISSRLGRALLIDLDEAVTQYIRMAVDSQREETALPSPLDALVTEAHETHSGQATDATNSSDDEEDGEDVDDASHKMKAYDHYLLALLPMLPGFHSVTQYEDNIPMNTSLHHVFWASNPEAFLSHACSVLTEHAEMLWVVAA